MKHALMEPVIAAFLENGDRYNLLNSAILELFEFMWRVSGYSWGVWCSGISVRTRAAVGCCVPGRGGGRRGREPLPPVVPPYATVPSPGARCPVRGGSVQENMKGLLASVVASPQWEALERVDYVSTFQRVLAKHEQNVVRVGGLFGGVVAHGVGPVLGLQ